MTTTVAGELCPDGGEGRKLLRGLGKFCEVGRERKIRGHGKAGEEAYHSRLGVAYGSGGACGVRRNLSIRLPHVSNGRFSTKWVASLNYADPSHFVNQIE
jgi:hypothetical protein